MMLSTQQARDALLAAATLLVGTDTVSTEAANNRVLAEDIVSPIDVPPMDVSAMDGYAVRCGDVIEAGMVPSSTNGDLAAVRVASLPASSLASPPASLPISQRIAAGASPTPLTPGSVARIFTGAPIPFGADAVMIQEDALPSADGGNGRGRAGSNDDSAQSKGATDATDTATPLPSVSFDPMAVPTPGQWINRRGADIRAGSVILRAGTRMTPQALGLAASVGVASVRVVRRLKVAMLFTGDELKRPGEPLVPGAIYNSNRYTLSGLLENLGCEITDYGIVADRLDATRQALREAAATHDLVITCGGVSVGEEDHVKPAVEAEGRLDLWKIAMKPGKPLAFGTLRRPDGQAWFIGLPGNPVSTFVTFLLFVRPFLLRLQGVQDVMPKGWPVRADFATKGDRRNEFLRVRLNAEGGLDLYATQSSAVLTSTVWGDGLVDNPPDRAIAVGDTVHFIPFSEMLY